MRQGFFYFNPIHSNINLGPEWNKGIREAKVL